MTAERVARLRDDVRAGLRGHYVDPPLDSAIDSVLRDGLEFVSDRFPPIVMRATIPEGAVTNDLLDLSALVPDLRQLLRFTWPLNDAPMPYAPHGGSQLLFHPYCAPRVGAEVEIAYKPVLTVIGFDGAIVTNLPVAYDRAWMRAAVYAWIRDEHTYAQMLNATPERDRVLSNAVKSALENAEAAMRSLGNFVSPIAWGSQLVSI